MELREVTYLAVILRVVAAVLAGGILGMERGLKNRAAGLRTYMLVCVGACLIMLTNQFIYQTTSVGDPVRMGAQVVSGIGFLGAGTIIVTRRSQIKGLTTAAGLWASAGVGLALGIGFYEAAFAGTAAIFAVMTLLQRMDNRMRSSTRRVGVYVELSAECSLGDFLRQIRGLNMEASDIQQEYDADKISGSRAYTATIKLPSRQNHALVLDQLQELEGVVYVDEL